MIFGIVFVCNSVYPETSRRTGSALPVNEGHQIEKGKTGGFIFAELLSGQ